MRKPILSLSAAGLLALMAPLHPAAAAPLSSNGITFSDEFGGFTIESVTGSGSMQDPFVVVEEITGPLEAVLIIRGLTAEFGNRVGTHHLTGFALKKIVTNRTTDIWNLFEMELRETLAHQSPYGDGLSFGQASTIGRPFTSSTFAANNEIDEPYDSVSFQDGSVRPGETVSFDLIVTDTSPVPTFLLLQQPSRIVASVPAPRRALTAALEPGCAHILTVPSNEPLTLWEGAGAGAVVLPRSNCERATKP